MHGTSKRAGRRGLVRTLSALVLGLLAGAPQAQTTIDNTCATCGRRALDSANLVVNPIRVNQVGYRTDDPAKRALVADPRATSFQVVRANRTVAYSGSLASLGNGDRGRMAIKGAFNSTKILYEMSNDTANRTPEKIHEIQFGPLREEGRFRIAVGPDTSLPFEIRPTIYNDVLETSLKFFGIARSGDNDSWFHGPSHMKDGSARGPGKAGSLQGGWYDCGDHFKVGQTIAYAFNSLILTYTLWPQKAEDRFGSSYNDTIPFGNDGIPDILREAKIGADWVIRLYEASKEDGLLARKDMYLQVGVDGADHAYWDKPENQDAQPAAEGGPDRVVHSAKGSATPAAYAGSLALFARAWEPFDPVYADSCLKVARDIYAKVVIPNRLVSGFSVGGFYIEQGRWDDDLAWAAAGLWIATGDTAYKHDLMGNKTYGNNPGSVFNPETFPAGFLAMHASRLFSPGGWIMDYQNNFIHTVWLLHNMVYRTDSLAATRGIPAVEAGDMRNRLRTLVRERYARESSDGSTPFPGTNADVQVPYSLVWMGNSWGMNRYNLGGLLPIVAYHDFIRADSAAAALPYWKLVLNNMNYNLGTNPWDMSFLMGAGSKNLQHPHHRASNPEGYDAGGIPYEYRSPKGALMGGAIPGQVLVDYWRIYDATETCIDFSAQLLLPAQYLAEDLPPDLEGPKFSNVVVVQVTNTSAIVSWETNELSRDTLFYSLTPGGPVVGQVVVNLAKKKSAEITGLTPNTTYHFHFKGMDIFRNVSRDDNRGRYYTFTTTTTAPPPAKISDVRVCNIRADRATVFWWTDVPSTSAVEFALEGANFQTTKVRVDGDDEGIPGRFHKVTLKGLKPGTAYRYDAISGSARSDSGGLHHRFQTLKDFANYSVQIKATQRNGAANAHFYLEVANNEPRPYVGLELRFYFQADAATARKVVIRSNDLQKFDQGGMASALRADFGSAVAVPGIANQWYLPITLLDTLVVAGRARIEMRMTDSNQTALPLSIFRDAWSLAPHATPVAFPGVDFSYLWKEAEPVEDRNGVPTVTYLKDPYIAGFSQGVHIFGYPPDGTKPKVVRTTDFRFATPRPSPATSARQDSLAARFTGRTWSFPDVVDAQWQVDGPLVRPDAALAGQTDSVAFRHDTLEAQGTTSHEFAFWGDRDSTYCSCAWSRYTVAVDTQKVMPPRYRLEWRPDSARSGLTGRRIPLVLVLASDSLDTVKVSGTVALVSSLPDIAFFATATGGLPTTSVTLVDGTATVWVVSDSVRDSARLAAAGTVPGAVVDAGISGPVSFFARIPPRYRLTWSPDSVRSTLVGSRLAYTISFASDTLALEPVAGQIELRSVLPGVVFHSSMVSTVPVTMLSVVGGQATVFVTSPIAVDSTVLWAKGSVLDALVDSGSSRFASFLPPPPWPRIDSALALDIDCDGRTDRLAVHLSGAPGTSRLVGLDASIGLDSLRGTTAWNFDSTLLTLTLATPIPGTAPAGTARVRWNAVGTGNRDTLVAVSSPIRDRVGPRLVSASVLENFRPATVPDTLRVEFSEPVVAPVSGWPFAPVVPASPALLGGRALTPTVWEWTTAPGAAIRVNAGQILRGTTAPSLTDALGNTSSGCGTDSALVQLRTRPVPLKAAVALDLDRDGRPDHVRLSYERGLRAIELPDSVRLVWDGAEVVVPATGWTRSLDSLSLLATLLPPWTASIGGPSARVVATKGTGANLWMDSIALSDSVGPSLRGAVLRFGSTTDTLILGISEVSVAGPGIELVRFQRILSQAVERSTGQDGRTRLVFPAGVLEDGDSLRLSPVWLDASANAAAPLAPWVAVVSGDRPPVDASLLDSDGDGRADLVHLRWDRPVRRKHGYVFTWLSEGAWVARSTDTSSFALLSLLEAQVRLAEPFPFGATGLGTLPGAPAVQIESLLPGIADSLPFQVRDSVDPIVLGATVRYSAVDGDPDTLVARFSETLLLLPVLPQVVLQAKGPRKSLTPVAQWMITQSSDGRTAWLLLQPWETAQTAFDLGDSVRIAPRGQASVRDPLGNVAAGASPWVRVTFGPRPSRFVVSMHPKTMHLAFDGTVPVGEQLRVLVRPRGKLEWTTLDGVPAGDVVGRIGPMISINGGFGGRVHLYDNLGVSVASVDLTPLEQAWTAGALPTDPSGQYEVWVSWNGASREGKMVGSGVYTARLVLRRDLAPVGEDPQWSWTNDLIRFGWKISLQ
jgi:hypothetical protein